MKSGRSRAGKGSDGRRTARFGVEGIASPFGNVVDISEGGLRVACEKKPGVEVGSKIRFWLKNGNQTMSVIGRVTRVRRKGWRAFEVGVELQHESPVAAKALVSLARFGYVPKVAEQQQKQAAADAAHMNQQAKRPAPSTYKLPNHYATLGLPISATPEQIRKAYRALALELHPDLTSDPKDNERFLQVRQAYEVLRDADAKSHYDALAQRVFAEQRHA